MTHTVRSALFVLCIVSFPGCAREGQTGAAAAATPPAASAIASTAAGAASAPDMAQAAGLYLLRGDPSTRSMMRLKDDGGFEFAASEFKGTDRARYSTTAGRWFIENDRVILIADAPGPKRPAFRADAVAPWSADDERNLREQELRIAQEAVLRRCAFLRDADPSADGTATAVATAVAATDDAPSTDEVRRQAETSLPPLRAAIAALEDAARDAMTAQAAADHADASARERARAGEAMAAATAAMSRYREAMSAMEIAYGSAGLETPGGPVIPGPFAPRYPDQCVQPTEVSSTPALSAATREPGFGINITSLAGLDTHDVLATYEFSDGSRLDVVPGDNGWAWFRARRDKTLERVRIRLRGGDEIHTSVIPVLSTDAHMLLVVHDPAGLDAGPFERFELRREGKELVPATPAIELKGRYVRY